MTSLDSGLTPGPGQCGPDSQQLPAQGPLLLVKDVHVAFPTSGGAVRAVDGVSFTLNSGSTMGIVGESGSGKSMLMRAVMNILPDNAVVNPQAQILLNGADSRHLDRAAARHFWGVQVAMVFQDPMTSLTPVLRIGRQMMEPLRYHLGLSQAQARQRALDLLREVGIADPERCLRQYPHNLSGGMRQRITIAMAVACHPTLLMADEPTTALDVTIQHQILNLLQRMREERQMAMVLVTHDLGVVASRTDEIMVMYAGRVVERAPTRILFKEMRHPYTEALLASIPRLRNPSHTKLEVIPGRSGGVVNPPPGCHFAARCRYAQARCLVDDPGLEPAGSAGHEYACFFPVGTERGRAALAANVAAGGTVAGLKFSQELIDVG